MHTHPLDSDSWALPIRTGLIQEISCTAGSHTCLLGVVALRWGQQKGRGSAPDTPQGTYRLINPHEWLLCFWFVLSCLRTWQQFMTPQLQLNHIRNNISCVNSFRQSLPFNCYILIFQRAWALLRVAVGTTTSHNNNNEYLHEPDNEFIRCHRHLLSCSTNACVIQPACLDSG